MKLPEKLTDVQLMAGIGVGIKINEIIDYLEAKENFHSETKDPMFKEEDVSIEQGFDEDMYWVRTKSLYASQAEAKAAREVLLKLKK